MFPMRLFSYHAPSHESQTVMLTTVHIALYIELHSRYSAFSYADVTAVMDLIWMRDEEMPRMAAISLKYACFHELVVAVEIAVFRWILKERSIFGQNVADVVQVEFSAGPGAPVFAIVVPEGEVVVARRRRRPAPPPASSLSSALENVGA